jgi:hypothetical protein
VSADVASSLTSGVQSTVDSALQPAWVRNGSSHVKQDYSSALAFEAVLVEQLTSTLSSSGAFGEEGGSESGEEGSGASTSSGFSQMEPRALAQGVTSGGGLGLADELTRQLMSSQGVSSQTQAQPPTGAGSTVTGAGGVSA